VVVVKRGVTALGVAIGCGAALYLWMLAVSSVLPDLLGLVLVLAPVIGLALGGPRLRRTHGRWVSVAAWAGIAPVLFLLAYALWFGWTMQHSTL
jgi:hypothetical protein